MKRTSVAITYLRLEERPSSERSALPAGVRVRQPEVVAPSHYRDLYNGVGRNWHWTDRAWLSDEEIGRLIHRTNISVFLLEVDGQEAGFAELEGRDDGSVQIAYFGLLPGYIGKGLARPFLEAVLDAADSRGKPVWLHTCSLDHPAALPFYRSAGFRPYRTESKMQPLRLDADSGTMRQPDP